MGSYMVIEGGIVVSASAQVVDAISPGMLLVQELGDLQAPVMSLASVILFLYVASKPHAGNEDAITRDVMYVRSRLYPSFVYRFLDPLTIFRKMSNAISSSLY